MRWQRVFGAVLAALMLLVFVQPESRPAAIEVTNISVAPGQPKPNGVNVMYWVPLAAPIERMPIKAASSYQCGQELTDWLEKYGRPLTGQKILLWNTSSTSQQVQIKVVGETRTDTEKGLVVQCGNPGNRVAEIPLPGAVAYDPIQIQMGGPYAGAYIDENATQEYVRTIRPGEQVGVAAQLFGDSEFIGQVRVQAWAPSQGTASVVPLRVEGSQVSSEMRWPGLRGSALMRVIFGDDDKLYCARVDSYLRGDRCELSMLRAQSTKYWEQDSLNRAAIRSEASHPANPIPASTTRTKITHLNPWTDQDPTSMIVAPANEGLSGCYQDRYRPDKIDCPANGRCYLNPDLKRALCPSIDLTRWTMRRIQGHIDMVSDWTDAAQYGPPKPSYMALKTADGLWCRIYGGTGPESPAGYTGWAGACSRPGSKDYVYLWRKGKMPYTDFGENFLLPPDGGNYYRIAIGKEHETPRTIDVTDYYY